MRNRTSKSDRAGKIYIPRKISIQFFWDFQDNRLSNTFRKECHRCFCLRTGLDLEVGKVGMNIELHPPGS